MEGNFVLQAQHLVSLKVLKISWDSPSLVFASRVVSFVLGESCSHDNSWNLPPLHQNNFEHALWVEYVQSNHMLITLCLNGCKNLPCSQLGCLQFLIWISINAFQLEEVALFIRLFQFDKPSLFIFHSIGNKLLTRSWNLWFGDFFRRFKESIQVANKNPTTVCTVTIECF